MEKLFSNKKLLLGILAVIVCLVIAIFIQSKNVPASKESPTQQVNEDKVKFEIVATDNKLGNEILKDKNLVIIWQPDCMPCEGTLKAVQKVYEEKKDINIIGLGYAKKGNVAAVKKKIHKLGPTFNNYYMGKPFLEKNPTIKGTPTFMFVDKEGDQVIPRKMGSDDENVDVNTIKTILIRASKK